MYNLLRFLKKYNFILLFLILETLCIIMLIESLPYQKRKMVSISNAVTGKIYKIKSNFINYFHLKEENTVLTASNAMLMKDFYKPHNDSIATDTNNSIYEFIPAQVINNSISHINNYLLIDKGRYDGIEEDMGVICDHGIVGKIANISNHYSSVISVLHTYSIISTRFIDNQYIANVCWDNKDYRFGIVKDIPLHLDLKQGDTVVTSGYSNIYPANIMVGTIENMIESDTKDFNTAKIRFSTNFSTLRHVYVIKNKYKKEIDSLIIQQEENE